MKTFNGNVLFLDRSDINTDEIIPAKYLTEISKEALGPHLLEDLSLPGFNPMNDTRDVAVIITRENFGCGSSREHAPWALEVNGIFTVIAQSFARIFRQNMFNCGMLAIELSAEQIEMLFNTYSGIPCTVEVDVPGQSMRITSRENSDTLPICISDYDQALVEAGGWVEYADGHY